MLSGEATNTNLSLWFDPTWTDKPTIYHTRGKHANHYATDAVCLLMDRDKMSNLYKGPPIVAFYQVSVYLIKRFLKRRFLEIDQSETRIAYGGHVFNRWGQNVQSL